MYPLVTHRATLVKRIQICVDPDVCGSRCVEGFLFEVGQHVETIEKTSPDRLWQGRLDGSADQETGKKLDMSA